MKKFTFSKSTWLFFIAFLACMSLQAQIYYGSISLWNQAQVDAFNYTEVTDYLEINNWPGSDITDLTPLSNLTSVGGDLIIIWNPALTSLDGLQNVTSVGGSLGIHNNTLLTNLEGLQNLISVGTDLSISRNSVLTSLDGLQNLSFLGDDLFIQINDALVNLDGLLNLTSVEGSLSIAQNNVLTNLDGLQNITSIGGGSQIYWNPVLTSLDGLQNLTSVGDEFILTNNAVLTNLDGLQNLTSVGGVLLVGENATLINFCGLYALLEGGGLVGSYIVYWNAENPTEQDIIANGACITNTPPEAICQDMTVFASENCKAMVSASEVDNGSSDPDGDDITFTLSPEGPFDVGVTTVTLIVTDENGETDECTSTITVVDGLSILPISVTPSPAVPGQSSNTIYLGYGPQNVTLTASGGISYTWSPSTGLSCMDCMAPVASPIETTNYTVLITKENGCIATASVTIFVMDVKCGKNMDKVLVCHNGNTLCISSNAVQAHLNHGDYLGTCLKNGVVEEVDQEFTLLQNYPNPFKTFTIIEYSIPNDATVSLRVYNMLGHQVSTLVNGKQEAGKHVVELNANDLHEGIYTCVLEAEGEILKRIMIRLQ